MKVFENFLPKVYVDTLESVICGPDFTWNYSSGTDSIYKSSITTIYETVNTKTKDTFQFCHSFFRNDTSVSKYFEMIYPILFHISEIENKDYTQKMHRIKANLITNRNDTEDCHHFAHIDLYERKAKSFLYYVNDSDGDTYFFNESWEMPQPTELTVQKRITPKRGTGVFFDSSQYHASSSPIKNKVRCVINFILYDD